jgi:conjugal transfer pilus assembly protein TraV
MRGVFYKCAVLTGLLILGGCAGVFNPFQSEFECPKTANGRCISIKEAYAEDVATSSNGSFRSDEVLPATNTSRSVNDDSEQANRPPGCCGKPDTKPEPQKVVRPVPHEDTLVHEYREASLQKVTKLLRDPVTPLIAPPLAMRVLILPYEDSDGVLNLQRFKFIMVDRPKWVLGDYLAAEEEGAD